VVKQTKKERERENSTKTKNNLDPLSGLAFVISMRWMPDLRLLCHDIPGLFLG
jgi:hypothetical protein